MRFYPLRCEPDLWDHLPSAAGWRDFLWRRCLIRLYGHDSRKNKYFSTNCYEVLRVLRESKGRSERKTNLPPARSASVLDQPREA